MQFFSVQSSRRDLPWAVIQTLGLLLTPYAAGAPSVRRSIPAPPPKHSAGPPAGLRFRRPRGRARRAADRLGESPGGSSLRAGAPVRQAIRHRGEFSRGGAPSARRSRRHRPPAEGQGDASRRLAEPARNLQRDRPISPYALWPRPDDDLNGTGGGARRAAGPVIDTDTTSEAWLRLSARNVSAATFIKAKRSDGGLEP